MSIHRFTRTHKAQLLAAMAGTLPALAVGATCALERSMSRPSMVPMILRAVSAALV